MVSASTPGFTCNTCSTDFEGAHIEQRSHVKEPWHQYNLQRRVAALPPITLQQFQSNAQSLQAAALPGKTTKSNTTQTQPEFTDENDSSSDPSDDESVEEGEEQIALDASICLFCNDSAPSPAANLSHMATVHDLFVPDPDALIDLETFLLYLAAIVFRYRECLYCGTTKGTSSAAQAHMRDKGHCMLDLAGDDCGLLEFWEEEENENQESISSSNGDGDDEGSRVTESAKSVRKGSEAAKAIGVSETEMRLPSGAIVGSRRHAENVHNRHGLVGARVQAARRRKTIADSSSTDAAADEDKAPPQQQQPSTDRRVAVRNEMGLVGLPEQQRRALVAVEKKMMKREAVARAAQRWATEKVANRQKYFKPDVPGRKTG